jgi:hypothetical protein
MKLQAMVALLNLTGNADVEGSEEVEEGKDVANARSEENRVQKGMNKSIRNIFYTF